MLRVLNACASQTYKKFEELVKDAGSLAS